jgi:hypothetical protein
MAIGRPVRRTSDSPGLPFTARSDSTESPTDEQNVSRRGTPPPRETPPTMAGFVTHGHGRGE